MFYSLPPATWGLLIANTVIFLLQMAGGNALLVYYFGLWPLTTTPLSDVLSGGTFMPWQLITYSFLHGGVLHLLLNMYALYLFGADLERVFGERRYLALYFASVLTAGVSQLLWSALTYAPPFPTIGASGGVFGLLLAYGMYFPDRIVTLIFPPVALPARLFVILYGALELYLGVTGTATGVAHFAHLGGMLGSYLVILYWRGGPRYHRWRGERRD
ncbi:MAG: rhomboid family intramembrane serine protease [Nitrososphaerota archaeon]